MITYDDSGAFTINERRAASQKIMDKYNRNGEVSSKTYSEILDYYKSLPAIEEAQLPKGYDTQLQSRVQQASETDSAQNKRELDSLMELVAQKLDNKKSV